MQMRYNQKRNAERFVDAVTSGYVETGKPLDAKQIAERMGVSVSTVHKILKAQYGCPIGIDTWQDSFTRYSTNYRGMEAGSGLKWIYAPSRETLRTIIIKGKKGSEINT
jgi:DNA-directed RNA polymerase specialized sigma54-like protein